MSEDLREEIKRLTEEGNSPEEIHKKLDIHVNTVRQIKRDLGITSEDVRVKKERLNKWVKENPEVERVCSSLNPKSKPNYYAVLKIYSEWAGLSLQELWAESWEDARDRIVDFKIHLEEINKAPNTIHRYISSIRRFYEYQNMVFKGKFLSIRRIRPKEINEKELILPDKLLKIIESSSLLERTMYIVQFQSGLGAFELCHLKIGDIADINGGDKVDLRIVDDVIKLNLVRKKTGVKFTTFIGHDAIEYLEQWIEQRQNCKVMRDRELSKDARIKSKDDYLFISYSKRDREFRRVSETIYARYLRDRVRELGWITDENMKDKGQFSAFRPHALRMSFSEIMKHKAQVSWDFVEVMLGHKFNSTDSAYVKFDDNDLLKAYKQGEPFLSLMSAPPVTVDILELMRKREGEISSLKRENEALKALLQKSGS
jgi:integrase